MQRKLTAALLPLITLAAIAVAGCSSEPPATGSGTPAVVSATDAAPPAGAASSTLSLFTAPPAPTTSSGAASESLTGLSDACAAVVDTQLAIAALLARPVDGHELSKADVRTVFSALDPAVPHGLDGDVATLHDAATRSVGKSDVEVAAILAEKKVAGAVAALSAYVKGCSPATS